MKCTTKPVTKDCFQVTDPNDRDAIQSWADSISDEFNVRFFVSKAGCLVHTPNGSQYATTGDWIVKEHIGFGVLSGQRFNELYDVQEPTVKEIVKEEVKEPVKEVVKEEVKEE